MSMIDEDGKRLDHTDRPSNQVINKDIPESIKTIGIVGSDQKTKWYNIRAKKFSDSTKYRALVTFSEITKEVERAQSLKASKNLLSLTQNIAKIGSWSFNINTKKIKWSEQLYKFFPLEINKGDLDYESYRATLHPDDLALWDNAVAKCLKDAEQFVIRFRAVHPDKIVWVESRGEASISPEGQIQNLFGTCQDITDLVQEKNRSQQLSHDLDQVTKNIPALIYQFLLRKNGSTTMPYLVTEGLKLFDCTKEDYDKDNNFLIKMVYAEDISELIESIQKSAKNLSTFDWRGRFVTKKGRTIWTHVSSIPKALPNGDILWDGVLMDITREKELENALAQERSRSLHQSKLATLGEMASGIAHEINNPLAIVQASIDLLGQNIAQNITDKNKFAARIKTIENATKRIGKIINGLRKFSRTTEIKDKKHVSVRSLFSECETLIRSKAILHNVQIQFHVDPDFKIFCDEIEFEQVLVNMINNSIDAVNSLNIKWVTLVATKDHQKATITVTDSGSGLSPTVKEKIFNPFFTTKPTGEGTGLGLSIAKGIITDHGGDIVISEQNPNTCFEIRLPL